MRSDSIILPVKIAELLIAAVAARSELTVVHYDDDHYVIAGVAG